MNPVHLTLYYNIYNIIINNNTYNKLFLKKLPVSPHERASSYAYSCAKAHSWLILYILKFYNASKINKNGPRRAFKLWPICLYVNGFKRSKLVATTPAYPSIPWGWWGRSPV